jgi:hypothetical protein
MAAMWVKDIFQLYEGADVEKLFQLAGFVDANLSKRNIVRKNIMGNDFDSINMCMVGCKK